MEEIVYLEEPDLRSPYLIIGFEGWPNAAEISSSSILCLIEGLKASKFASIPAEGYYQMSDARPVAVIKEGRLVHFEYPGNHFYYSRQSFSKDVILFYGVEPHLRWSAFADCILSLADTYRVSQIFLLGGTYDYVPHTYPPIVSGLFNHDDLREGMLQAGIRLTEYTGPISIHTFLLESARKRGLKAISLWGHAPQYLQTKNMRVVCTVLKKLVRLARIVIDLSEVERASDYFDRQVSQLVEQDPKLQEVIARLEEAYKESGRSVPIPEKEEGAKEDKVVYIEAFLKKQDDEEKK